MLRLFSILFYCTTLSLCAQHPALTLSAGAAMSNDAMGPQATFRLLHDVANIMPGSLKVGITAGQLYSVPTLISATTSSQSTVVRTQGSSTITTLMATIGYGVSFDVVSVSVLGSLGGANVAYRQYSPYDLPPNFYDDGLNFYSTVAVPSLAYGVALQADIHLSETWSISLVGGRDWFRSEKITADNAAYSAPSFKATFTDGSLYLNAGLSYRFNQSAGSAKVAGEPPDSLDGEADKWYVNAIINSIHPFTDATYNQFNPGLAVHWRDRSQGATWFAEGGAYQYSESDRAMFAGGGVLFPIGTEWIKVGAFGGVITLHGGDRVRVSPALSPRLTIDTPWLSATALLIPAGESTAVGFFIGIPLK